jgi:hypothetical protein
VRRCGAVALCPITKKTHREDDHHNDYYDLNNTRERHFTASETHADFLTDSPFSTAAFSRAAPA